MDANLKQEDLDENVLKIEEMDIFTEDEKNDPRIVHINDIGNDYEKLKLLKNPKVKKHKLELLPDTVLSRLKLVGLDLFEVDLDIATREVYVSRLFMAKTYGGSMQATTPHISQEFLNIHGLDDFMYANRDYQPYAPEIVGASGLFFCTQSGPDMDGLLRLFVKIFPKGLGGNIWQYLGMYEVKSCPSLTKEEWASENIKMRNVWATEICKQKWGNSVRARVRGRKEQRREPTAEELDDIFANERHLLTTPDEVNEAYMKGEERLGVWTMKCVGYDVKFQKELAEKFATWTPPPAKRKAKKTKNVSIIRPTNQPAARRKRKHSESEDSESGSDELESDNSERRVKSAKKKRVSHKNVHSDNEAEEKFVYKPRGTRSRPICVDECLFEREKIR